MTRKERIMAAVTKNPVDRPPFNFYEINSITQNQHDTDIFNIYSDESWRPLLKLTEERSDIIVTTGYTFTNDKTDSISNFGKQQIYYDQNNSRYEKTVLTYGKYQLSRITRRDRDIDTVWEIEHMLKSEQDLKVWIDMQNDDDIGIPDYSLFKYVEKNLSDRGVMMIDTPDALAVVAGLLGMENFTIIALTEPKLFHRALEKAHQTILKKAERISKDYPGRLWRIYGPEYASPPYLPPYLYEEYVVRYDTELVRAIHSNGGFARIHQHGKMKDILPFIEKTGCIGFDPIEPEPQGDVSLSYIRERYADRFVLFGNLEINDIEMLPSNVLEKKIATAIEEGMGIYNTGFILMPSASPYGRKLSDLALENYYKIVEMIERYTGVST